MNKEIVGILRAGGIPHEMYAAQYIEELQAKIEQLEAEIERLRDKNERLKDALRSIATTSESWGTKRVTMNVYQQLARLSEIARDALR
jgi:predicted RNase H-like nuclease (RuvC/YqgF family)